MGSDLPLPPHLKQAQQALLTADLPAEALAHALAALQLAAGFYQATPQVSRTDQLRRERDRTQHELERVSADLLAARKTNGKLLTSLSDLTSAAAAARQEVQREADQKVGVYMSIVTRLRNALHALATILQHAQAKPETKVRAAKQELAAILAGSSNRKHRLLAAQLLAMPTIDSVESDLSEQE